MDTYTVFAEVYDRCMEEIPYEDWCRQITSLLCQDGIVDGLVLELGCGTGTMTELLAQAGYDMIGVDASGEMLSKAIEKRNSSGQDILYLQQDMREFELYGTVRAVVSVCDTMNYLLEEEELLQVFRLVNNYLDPKGLFLFDLKTEHHFRDVVGTQSFVQNEEDVCIIWENYYYEEEQVNEYAVTIFAAEEDGRYERQQELHYQKPYTIAQIQRLLQQAGMEFVAAYGENGEEASETDSSRIYILARECGK
ncbi:MAG: class I SAM-dependent methyltransferase [Lachnospiraceae bacterium]|nr:class I SAM-dependent methyltransferase [Lachnospiraceae bacterium]